MTATWALIADNPNRPTGNPVTLTLSGHATVLTADEARELAEALLTAAAHQGHDGDASIPMFCALCATEHVEDGQPDWGATPLTLAVMDGPCRQCGSGHEVGPDGLCRDECGACDLDALNGTLTGCRFDGLAHASDVRRKAL